MSSDKKVGADQGHQDDGSPSLSLGRGSGNDNRRASAPSGNAVKDYLSVKMGFS